MEQLREAATTKEKKLLRKRNFFAASLQDESLFDWNYI